MTVGEKKKEKEEGAEGHKKEKHTQTREDTVARTNCPTIFSLFLPPQSTAYSFHVFFCSIFSCFFSVDHF